jgi:hypothetical protein
MGIKRVTLPTGQLIIDGFSKLLIIEDVQTQDIWEIERMLNQLPCEATTFTTKKGREAIRIAPAVNGATHTISFKTSGGDRSWGGWAERQPANAWFSEAVATSNGGGCWAEVIIMAVDSEAISREQQDLMDELIA